MEDGSAIRPPMGKRDVQERGQASEPERGAGLAEAEGNGLEPGPEVLGVEGAAPDGHGEPGDRERLEHDPDLRKREEEEEDLDEDRGVADDLDVDRRELADTGTRCARAAPRTSPMTKAPAIAIAETSSVRRRPARSSSPFSETNDQSKATASDVTASGRQERPREARPLRRSDRTVPLRAHRREIALVVGERSASAAGCSSRTARPGQAAPCS